MKAIMPINHARITAGYLNEAYRRKFGFAHYGTDFVQQWGNDRTIYAPFPMKILAVGRDRLMGNVIVAESLDKIEIHNGKFKGERKLIVRMAHLASYNVKKGEVVRPEDKSIGRYGNTSGIVRNMAAHLHIEFDTDLKYPFHTPTLAGDGNIWKAGVRTASKLSTVNPMDVLKVDTKGKFGGKQTFTIAKSALPFTHSSEDRVTLALDGSVVKAEVV